MSAKCLLISSLLIISNTLSTNDTCDISFGSGVSSSSYQLISGYNDVLGSQIFLSYYDTALKMSTSLLNTLFLRHPGGTVAS